MRKRKLLNLQRLHLRKERAERDLRQALSVQEFLLQALLLSWRGCAQA